MNVGKKQLLHKPDLRGLPLRIKTRQLKTTKAGGPSAALLHAMFNRLKITLQELLATELHALGKLASGKVLLKYQQAFGITEAQIFLVIAIRKHSTISQ